MNKRVLITGGAGFIGSHLAHRLLSQGHEVRIFDDLSRPGVEHNLHWLCSPHGSRVQVQVAVTSSLLEPLEDFEINVRGTLNLLEALRQQPQPVALVFTSTNKVYGALAELPLSQRRARYEPAKHSLRLMGIGEDRPLAFHSPYGCSKGALELAWPGCH